MINGMIAWWHDYIWFLSTSSNFAFYWYSRNCDRRTDGLTDRWMEKPSYRDARMHLVSLIPLVLIYSKLSILFVYNESISDGWTDGRTNRRIDQVTEMRGCNYKVVGIHMANWTMYRSWSVVHIWVKSTEEHLEYMWLLQKNCSWSESPPTNERDSFSDKNVEVLYSNMKGRKERKERVLAIH